MNLLMLNKRVKISKGKSAKWWKIIGISLPLPEIGGGEMKYLIVIGKIKLNINPKKILEVRIDL